MSSTAALFMKLNKLQSDGTTVGNQIKGDAVATGFTDQIEIDNWDWGVARKASDSMKGSYDTGTENQVEPSVFTFSKSMDRASMPMLASAAAADLLQAVITLKDSSMDNDFQLVITMTKVGICDYDMNAQNEAKSGSVEEKWTFDYETISFNYVPVTSKGGIAFQLTRPPGSDTKPAGNDMSKWISDAEKFTVKDLEPACKSVLSAATERAKMPPPKPDAKQPDARS